MTSEELHELETCFHQVADLPAQEQQRVLGERYHDRPRLRRRLEALLAGDLGARRFLERPALEAAPGPPAHDLGGRVVGRWRLVRPIGAGGMGSVWLAHRSDGSFEHVAAVKLLRAAECSDRLRQRFEVEKHALAQLDHPNIARLLDSGTADDGTPYLVMELVDGLPIDEYCDRNGLPVSGRLELFRTVCLAVHVAHRNLVVHRDLKPGNILVTGDGVPKLVDFGIAKLLEPGGQRGRTTTQTQIMTPEFASPEQVRSEPVTTATDVYSLGVVLYMLLTGQRPYQLGGLTPARLESVVCQQEPLRPSTAVGRDSVRRRLRGDLDNIVMMALRKEPERRYASAAELAEDIRRCQAGLPVAARQDTVWYRTRKFVGRNRVPTVIAAILLVSLAVGAGGMAWQRDIASRQRDRAQTEAESARRVSEFLVDVFKVSDPNGASGDTITARQVLDQASKRLEQEADLDPPVRATLSDAIGRVYMNLGLYEPAQRQLEDALQIRRKVFGEDDDHTRSTLSSMGELHYATGQYSDAKAIFEGLLASYERGGGPETAELAEAINNLAATRRALGDNDGAEPLYRRSLEIRRRLLGPDDPAVAESLNNLSGVYMARGDLEPAREYLRQALEVRERALGVKHPLVAQTISNLAVVAQMKGDLAAAEPLYRESLERFREALGTDHPSVATTAASLGSLLQGMGRNAEALTYLREALAIQRNRLGSEHPRIATTLTRLAMVLEATGDTAAARDAISEAMAIRRATLPAGHPQTANTLQAYGALLVRAGEADAAEPLLREAVEIYRASQPPDSQDVARAEQALAKSLAGQHRYREAEAILAATYETMRAARGENDAAVVDIGADLAAVRDSINSPSAP